MFNLFDMMRYAHGGAGLNNMARQFGLAPEQTQAAMAALVPALVMGLQRTAMNPTAMGEFTNLMSRGPFAAFFESAAQAFSPQAQQQGQQVLNHLFGSPEVSRHVAQQAAAFSGLSIELLRQMMPFMAGLFIGALLGAASRAGFGLMLDPDAETRRAAPPFGRPMTAWPWAEVLAATFGAAPSPPQAANPTASTPFEDMMSSILAGGRPPAVQPAQQLTEPSISNPIDAWSQLMNTGREMQRQHLAALQSLFDACWGSVPDKR